MAVLGLILGNTLFPNHDPLLEAGATHFFMAEDAGLCTHFTYHKHKLVLFLSAMRSHAEALEKQQKVHYDKLSAANKETSYEEKLDAYRKENPFEKLISYTIEDHFFKDQIAAYCKARKIEWLEIPSPGFLTSKETFATYLEGVKKPFMHTFYQQQRKRLGILVDGQGNPEGGKWSYDEDNRKKLPKGISIPQRKKMTATQHTQEVMALVNELFPDHPGNTKDFNWATTRAQVLDLLKAFLVERFQDFGPYEDAIHSDETFVFHTVLSPYVNLGLLTPDEWIDEIMAYAKKNDVHLPSTEGLVRQIIGWREFVRGIYHHYDLEQNQLDHHRKLTRDWYEGTTGIVPLDDSIKKVLKHGYNHHIERLMVIGNIMLLSRIQPSEVYKWFMEMYVDSSDWVMAPNVFSMSQFAEGGIFATKPYIAGSNYIVKMSNYKKGEAWCDTMDGLYWMFIRDHRPLFEANPRMSMMAKMLDKMKDERRETIFPAAEKFLESKTIQ